MVAHRHFHTRFLNHCKTAKDVFGKTRIRSASESKDRTLVVAVLSGNHKTVKSEGIGVEFFAHEYHHPQCKSCNYRTRKEVSPKKRFATYCVRAIGVRGICVQDCELCISHREVDYKTGG